MLEAVAYWVHNVQWWTTAVAGTALSLLDSAVLGNGLLKKLELFAVAVDASRDFAGPC